MARIALGTLCVVSGLSGASGEAREPRDIVGGERSPSKDAFPFIVKITTYQAVTCNGVIIHPRWVLTAAHCMVKDDGSPQDIWRIQANVPQLLTGGLVERVPLRMVLHPEWSKEGVVYRNDLALIQVTEPFDQTGPSQITIATDIDENKYAQSGTVATLATGDNLAYEFVEIPLFQSDTCASQIESRAARIVAQNLILTDRIVCTATVGRGGESGDSGSPLLVPAGNEERWLLVGILSQGLTNASDAPVANFYSRISQYDDWIQRVTSVTPGLGVPQTPSAGSIRERLVELIRLHAEQSRSLQHEMQEVLDDLKRLEK